MDVALSPVMMVRLSPYPFKLLAHLDLGLVLHASPEVSVIFASNVFHHLKTLRLHGSSYYRDVKGISSLNYLLMLRSITP